MLTKGISPKGYQVHHKIPLDDGGTNEQNNFILIRNDIEHRALHGFFNPMELRIELLKPGEKAKVAIPIPPEDSVIYPNESKSYTSQSVEHSTFMEQFHDI